MATAAAIPQQPLALPTAVIEITTTTTTKTNIAAPNSSGLNASTASSLDLDPIKRALVDVIKAQGGEDEDPAPTEEFIESSAADHEHEYALREVAEHRAVDDLWIVIDGIVYDVTRFQHEHPGGHKVMAGVAGKDATKKFDKYHRRAILEKYKTDLQIGTVSSDKQPTGKKGLLGKLGAWKR